MQLRSTVLLAAAVAVLSPQTGLRAQSFRRGGTEFNALRTVSIPPGEIKPVMVTEFFHHGQISPDCKNVIVMARNQKMAPCRVLQLGPGDFCRLAFQTLQGQTTYEVYYGGEPPEKGTVPAWTNRDGLLLETRRYKQCNLNQLDSVRKAFESSERIGSDYVENVQHSHNPFSLRPEPFLSHYSGQLHVGAAGKYGFLTSSRDCSFLLIDGKEVISAPGRHGPMHQANRGSRKDIQLQAGAHRFDYYHAASGPEAIMVAAWEVNASDPKPKPVAIPTEAFRTGSIGRVQAGPVQVRDMKMAPDFLVAIAGDVPLPDNDQPLVGVRFKDVGAKALTMGGKARWDFGDGQTGTDANPVHVYLRPGVYPVKLTVKRSPKTSEIVNRVSIDRPTLTAKDKLHTLDEYLPVLATYEPRTLDAAALRQLVLAYVWKVELLLAAEPADATAGEQEGESQPQPPKDPAALQAEAEAKKAEALKYVTAAVTAGKVAFLEESAANGDDELHKLVRLIGPMARDQLGDSYLAGLIWHNASRRITRNEIKAECEIEAADVAVNDLVNAKAGKSLLEAATAHFGKGRMGAVASRLQRVWGDYHALTGDGEAARKAYNEAEAILGTTRSHIERTAWQGAHSRSAEQYLKTGELDRAIIEIRVWQEEFPAEKVDGYLNLMLARYWAGREKYAEAVAQAEQLLTVNAESPYIDQLLLLAADCEVKRGRVDRALATLHQLLKEYPGSPLVPAVRANIAKLESEEKR